MSALNSAKADVERFCMFIKGCDSIQLGLQLALATHVRHMLRRSHGWNLLEPWEVDRNDNFAALKLNQLIHLTQKEGQGLLASGMWVWLVTLRGILFPELKIYGREMWKELQRGIPYVKQQTNDALDILGIELEIDGYEQIPLDLEPIM